MHTFPGPEQRLLMARQHQAELIEEAARERLVAGRSSGAVRGVARLLSHVSLGGLYCPGPAPAAPTEEAGALPGSRTGLGRLLT